MLPRVETFDTLTSTNDYLRAQIPDWDRTPWFCTARQQTAGHGRHGRSWISPPGNLYFSLLWPWKEPTPPTTLSLSVGIVLAEMLQHLNLPQVRLKWPNDLYAENKKLGGILIEAFPYTALIGIGINVHTAPDPQALQRPTVSLNELFTDKIAIEDLRQLVQQTLLDQLPCLETADFKTWLSRWHALDLLIDKPIRFQSPTQIHTGIARGITETGQFKLEETTTKKLCLFSSGEIQFD